MELENMAANAVDTAPAETGGAEISAAGSAAAPSGASSAGHDVSQTKAFSDRLNKMSAERTDAAIAGLGMTNHFTGKPISTLAEMQDYRAMQAADEAGGDPESAAELSRLRAQVAEFQQRERDAGFREQEAAIRANPALSEVYDEYHDDVMQLMEVSASNGQEVDLDSALRVIMSAHYDDIRARDIEKAKTEALASVRAAGAASPGALGGGGANEPVDWANMSSEEFSKHLAIAKRGGYRKS